jgi:tryptophan synthase beta chain
MAMHTRFSLPQSSIPTHWYNILADTPTPMPPYLHPGTKQPATIEDFLPIFPRNLAEQEFSTERYIEIPDEVREAYALWRPTPLLRAVRLERALGTPAHIYYKYEGSSPVGSHKPNTAIPQAYYNKVAGTTHLSTETGAGQWGTSLALACNFFGLDCTVFMVHVSYDQKPYRRLLVQSYGSKIYSSPSEMTEFGRKFRAEHPDSPGSLGVAISEAVEFAVTHPGTKYTLGSVMNHVCLHQTVIGEEAIKQMEEAGEEPDIVIGCVGGGSNFAGIAFPFLRRKIQGRSNVRVIGVEPSSCPSLTKGELRYDFGDTAGTTPLMSMYTLGKDFMPPSIHAGGLRYHGCAPAVSHVHSLGLTEAVSYPQTKVFEAALQFARTEGLVPAPESSHAIRCAIDEALKAKEEGKKKVIVFNLSGHGLLDLASYDSYLSGKLKDDEE